MKFLRINALAALLAVFVAPSAAARESSLFELQRLGSEGPVILFVPALDWHAEAWRPVMESLAAWDSSAIPVPRNMIENAYNDQ